MANNAHGLAGEALPQPHPRHATPRHSIRTNLALPFKAEARHRALKLLQRKKAEEQKKAKEQEPCNPHEAALSRSPCVEEAAEGQELRATLTEEELEKKKRLEMEEVWSMAGRWTWSVRSDSNVGHGKVFEEEFGELSFEDLLAGMKVAPPSPNPNPNPKPNPNPN